MVNYGAPNLIERNLPIVDDSMTVVVVDNFSDDRHRADLQRIAKARGWLFEPNSNTGFGGGMNRGVRRAESVGCTAMVLVNPDLRISAATIRELASIAVRVQASIVAPAVVDREGRPWGRLGFVSLSGGGLRNHGGSVTDPRWLSGACLALSADTWRLLEGFSEDYFMYWEDVDLCYRLQAVGGVLQYRHDLQAVHEVGGTQGQRKSGLYYYYNCRNRLVFAAKHLSGRQKVRWVLSTPRDVRRVATRDSALTKGQRLLRALPPCLLGAGAGLVWLLRSLTWEGR